MYNNNGDMGPFYDAVYDEASLLCDNKTEVDTEILEPAPQIPSLAVVLTHADINKLKLVELKEELKKRACSIKGLKVKLNLRPKEAVENNIPLAANITDAIFDDLAGDEFALGSKWEFEGTDDDDICIEE